MEKPNRSVVNKSLFIVTLELSHLMMIFPYAFYVFFKSFVNPSADQPEVLYSNGMILFLMIVTVFVLVSFVLNFIFKNYYGIFFSMLNICCIFFITFIQAF